jgi:hypothetical protein
MLKKWFHHYNEENGFNLISEENGFIIITITKKMVLISSLQSFHDCNEKWFW